MRAGCESSASTEAQLAILFAQLIERLLFALDAVAALDGGEVLQAVDHDEREEHGDGGGKDAHFANAHRVSGLDQAGVVNALDEEVLRHADAPPALDLLRHQLGVALGDARAPSEAGLKIGCCTCRHVVLPQF